MPRLRYRYNKEACRYEPDFPKGKERLKRISFFLLVAVFISGTAFWCVIDKAKSLEAIWLSEVNMQLKSAWNVQQKRIDHAADQLEAFIEKDDHNYRIILDAAPLPHSVREAGMGGSERAIGIRAFPGIAADYLRVNKLRGQVDIELQSFQQMEKLLLEKISMWSSRPAIQPIDNRQLDRLHLTYGTRLHPILNVVRQHNGLDFTASKGTPVYATGDGIVSKVYYSTTYGKVVFIDHGHGFETRYAHLSQYNVKDSEEVKRGQVIGHVGNTGTSVSSHLHYEVLYNGEHINPINFFQRDLSNEEYDKLVEISSRQSEPLD